MNQYIRAYLHNGHTVVTDKAQIMNARDDEFAEVTLLLPHEQIKRLHDAVMVHEEEEMFEQEMQESMSQMFDAEGNNLNDAGW